ncbi:hypothetical protein TWF281_011484 [Arthrobotrys megalospora]
MSLSLLPTEILLEIVKALKPDCKALHSLRLVSKSYYVLATEVLFEELSISYGLSRSIAQMKGITDSPRLHAHVKSLFFPSESFFPIHKDFLFIQKTQLPWTRNPPNASEIRSRGILILGDSKRYSDLSLHPNLFSENPQKWWIEFNRRKYKYKKQSVEYFFAFTGLVSGLVGLKRIHVALGMFWDSSRMRGWCGMFKEELWGVIADSGVKVVEVSVPMANGNVFLMFERCSGRRGLPPCRIVKFPRYGRIPPLVPWIDLGANKTRKTTSSVRSFILNIDGPSDESHLTTTTPELDTFFSNLPNLVSYTLNYSYPRDTLDVLPPPPTSSNLTSLTLSHINIPDTNPATFTKFQDLITQSPNLEHLTLNTINVLIIHRNEPLGYPSPFSCLQTSNNIPCDRISDPIPKVNWADILSFLAGTLRRLRSFKFRRLAYARHPSSTDESDRISTEVFVPMSGLDNCGIPEDLAGKMEIVELISPFEGDYFALDGLKRVVRGRGCEGLEGLSLGQKVGSGDVTGLEAYGMKHEYWQFIRTEQLRAARNL